MPLNSLTGEKRSEYSSTTISMRKLQMTQTPVRSGLNSAASLSLHIWFKLCNIGVNIHLSVLARLL